MRKFDKDYKELQFLDLISSDNLMDYVVIVEETPSNNYFVKRQDIHVDDVKKEVINITNVQFMPEIMLVVLLVHIYYVKCVIDKLDKFNNDILITFYDRLYENLNITQNFPIQKETLEQMLKCKIIDDYPEININDKIKRIATNFGMHKDKYTDVLINYLNSPRHLFLHDEYFVKLPFFSKVKTWLSSAKIIVDLTWTI